MATNVKEKFVAKIIEAIGAAYLGTQDKKYYFEQDGTQIAMTLTCPKTPIEFAEREQGETAAATPNPEFTPEERKNIENLMWKLNL